MPGSLEEQLIEALAVNERLIIENSALRDRIVALEDELARSSNNSSKPPSTDPIGPRQSRAERRAAARAEGPNKENSPALPARTCRVAVRS